MAIKAGIRASIKEYITKIRVGFLQELYGKYKFVSIMGNLTPYTY